MKTTGVRFLQVKGLIISINEIRGLRFKKWFSLKNLNVLFASFAVDSIKARRMLCRTE
jgi:hypothetical protein